MIGTIIDIEATGYLSFKRVNGDSVLSDDSEILEVGYMTVDMDTREMLNYGTLYFYKPYFNVESDAQKVHGLTREFLQKYENDFENNLIALNSMLQSTCIIGKNSDKFDVPFIKAFISKHAGTKFDIPYLTYSLDMKAYNGGKVVYENDSYAIDLQRVFVEKFHELYYDKYTKWFSKLSYGRLSPELEDEYEKEVGHPIDYVDLNMHPPIGKSKRGTLSQYIEVINNGQACVDFLYNKMDKERTTKAHGALYDVVMTYVVWVYCCNMDIL